MPRPFSIAYTLTRVPPTDPDDKLCPCEEEKLLGEYCSKQRRGWVYLANVHRHAVHHFGKNPPEDVLRFVVVNTDVHETLHSLVSSSGSRAADRAHIAMNRLLSAAGQAWNY